MDNRRVRGLLQGIKPGEIITADWLNRITRAVNDNTRQMKGPGQVSKKTGDGSEATGGGGVGNETMKAYADEITTETVTLTDSNGDTVSVDRITQIAFTENDTGRTFTLQIDYTNNRP